MTVSVFYEMKNKSTVENFLTEHDLVLKLKQVTGIFT
jgi:hypothetical protein